MSAALDTAAATVLEWSGPDVLRTINVEEARTVGALFAELGRPDVLAHLLRETWETEAPDDRDPTPWRTADGHRFDHEKAGATFTPRVTWEADTGD